jgi:hypothetical protein
MVQLAKRKNSTNRPGGLKTKEDVDPYFQGGITGYMVELYLPGDSFPIGLFESMAAADRFAKSIVEAEISECSASIVEFQNGKWKRLWEGRWQGRGRPDED